MDLIVTAKCGVLDRVFAGTFWLPLMPTVIAVSAFILAHVAGRLLAKALSIRPLELRRMWPIARVLLASLCVILALMIAVRGVAYPLFLFRMIKDAYYCSWFEAGRDLQHVHFWVFALTFLTQTACVTVFDDRRFRQLEPKPLKLALAGIYMVLAMAGYLTAIALDATLVPLTLLFMLPFAYCGIGILARLR